MSKYIYKCPDCKKIVKFGDNFCKNCSCKLDWTYEINDKKVSKIKNQNFEKSAEIKMGLFLLLIQGIITMCGLITKNFDFDINSSDEVFRCIGFNIFLIVGIILLIRNRKILKGNLKTRVSIVMIVLILLCYIFVGVLHFGKFGILNIDNEDSDNSILRAKHILVDDYETAKEIINAIDLNGTEVFCGLAKKHSLDSVTNDRCGDVGNFEYENMESKFSDAVLELDIDEYTDKPVRTIYGYHIIMRIK